MSAGPMNLAQISEFLRGSFVSSKRAKSENWSAQNVQLRKEIASVLSVLVAYVKAGDCGASELYQEHRDQYVEDHIGVHTEMDKEKMEEYSMHFRRSGRPSTFDDGRGAEGLPSALAGLMRGHK